MKDTLTISVPATTVDARLAEPAPSLDGIGRVTSVGVVGGALRVSLTLTNGVAITLTEDVGSMVVVNRDDEVLQPDQVAALVDPFADTDHVDRELDALWLAATSLVDAATAAAVDAVAPTLIGILNAGAR
ncbi:hypothetical protein [Kutzneria sp. 744]|uniref:hypothetical protein n=1 Tax=Kutzneria sp. (strain 744) TaxID=345341 RepID=UPI0003EEC017|nr:hypothetical protein [Kutzneria sp. 744]EWM19706.1 hypothetical protein KUTG_10010 [Kutzneria sp. 744]